MAESPTAEKEDVIFDSSDEWTIIYNKEPRTKDNKEENADEPKETVVSEDACKTDKSNKIESEHVEPCEEAGEKELESDDVSVISDESELEHECFEEGKVQRIEWQLEENQQVQSTALATTTSSTEGSITSNTLIICSIVALILGIIISSQIMEFRGDYSGNSEMGNKLRDLSKIEETLKEINDMKTAVEQIQMNIPEMKKLKDRLIYQKSENNKPSYSVENYKLLEKFNWQIPTLLNYNVHNDKLELLDAIYQNFCSTIKRINSSNPVIENELCEAPKVLSEMVHFKKNLREAFQQTQGTMTPEKRILDDAEKKLNAVSDSLISEMSAMFSRFSLKVQDRLNKFGYKLNKRLCSMSNTGRTNDKFFNILLDKNFYIKKCNETDNVDAVVDDIKSNITNKKIKDHAVKKRSYEEFKKDDYKNDFKNSKDYKKMEDSREYNSFDKEYNEESNSEKSKGEVKSDNWKNNKYEKKDKPSDEKKYKQEKNDKIYKNEHNKKIKTENEFENSLENKVKEHNHDRKFEYNQRDNDYDRKSVNHNKKERDYDKKSEQFKKDNDFLRRSEHKEENGHDHQIESKKKDQDFNQKVEYHKKDKFEHKHDHNKKDGDFDRKFENKKIFNYDENNSAFIILEDNADELVTSNEFKPIYKKEKEFPQRPDSYKESKYQKYSANDRRDKKDKYQSSDDWQMQRSKAREKLRNSDWYFVRAELRHKARIVKNSDKEEEALWSPPRPPKKHQQQYHRQNRKNDNDNDDHLHSSRSRGPKDNLRKRVLRTVGQSWDFLNAKLRKYF